MNSSKTEQVLPTNDGMIPSYGESGYLQEEAQKPLTETLHYKLPDLNLLNNYDDSCPYSEEELKNNEEKILQTLANYGIEINSISATIGPSYTLFEIIPAPGTKIGRIRRLSEEIALTISNRSGTRIIAPIPGKFAIGIEMPHLMIKTVTIRECIESDSFQQAEMELPVAIGKTVSNEVYTFDLAKAPHLLISGATGQGKSVCLKAIITSLLYKKLPSQLKFILVDPKENELGIYSGIEKSYLAKLTDQTFPITTGPSNTIRLLQSICAEMEDRFALLQDAEVHDIRKYNEMFSQNSLNTRKLITASNGSQKGTIHRHLPYLVVIIDEYSDYFMIAGNGFSMPIAQIAQKARLVGIHLIITTQRPTNKIITAMFKANIPARIAFRVANSMDSNIILDQAGAQNLIGNGDFLISSGNLPVRVQGAFVETSEIYRINKYIAEQDEGNAALILPEPKTENKELTFNNGLEVNLKHLDPLFVDVAEFVIPIGFASTSMIQRKFCIGYYRARNIVAQLESACIVGTDIGSRHIVLVNSDSELRTILEGLNEQ